MLPTAPVQIEWDSPKALLESTISAIFSNPNHAIGHVNVEVSCAASNAGPEEHFFAGAVSLDRGASHNLLFQEKIGLSIMAGAWPGRLESEKEIQESLAYRAARREMLSAVTIAVAPATCRRLVQYYQQTQAESATRMYGFAARPRRHEGAGCSAFGASFLEVAGLLGGEIRRAWLRGVKVPLSLMTVLGRQSQITLQESIAHPDAAAWASGLSMDLSIFDPDLMNDWVIRIYDSAEERARFGAEVDRVLNAVYPKIRAIRVSMAHMPVPTEPIFEGSANLMQARPGFWIRQDIVQAEDGSFEFAP